ncbi:hypothetical protein [Pectobacterium parmentieri]|uniref:hypothetical protein n=1 Tax=Pectobacterium parmentieri TaxID=1905730 RepID=UPI000EB1F634|nr:hypothetical protein [Pectobacterium parmentieri]AYH20938.1 hypothetical protein C5E22_22260 [Pectobacterium parmentieri]AYH25198.1 hypothetical protein C5E21_21230 [Pectobacterium parmentieri]MBI0549570.1 hypothetical protein [Pectobacterium parmentieri]MBI0558587.1 hypothetical protein [Pectobacterium parmentieri]MBI0562759.1 hypothetical protein [Pectobacterium parmentieri]
MFYEKLNEVTLIVDSGIYFEIRDFFLSQDAISVCEINIIEDRYNVLLKGGADRKFYNNMFFSFVNFIQYSYLTCYINNVIDDDIVYELITANEKMKGFYCKIIVESNYS